jgi:hypothetical protein
MKITFVGHVSVPIEESGVGLLMDPWLKGEAFNDSWTLYPQPLLRPENLAHVTRVWMRTPVATASVSRWPESARVRIASAASREARSCK